MTRKLTNNEYVQAVVIVDDDGNIGMSHSASSVAPDPQASTDNYTLVDGSILDTLHHLCIAYSIENSGTDNIKWEVRAGNAADLSDEIVVGSEATVTAGSFDNYSETIAVWRYYGVYIKSAVSSTPGEATVLGVSKG